MKILSRSIVNPGLFISAIVAAFTGMLIQIKFHIGHRGNIETNDYVLGINYSGWSGVHKFSIVILSLLMIYHIYKHWKWYSIVFKKRIFARHKQVLTLSVLFALVALTGLIPWFINMQDGSILIRKAFIEVHDKLAIVLILYLFLHIIKRYKKVFLVNNQSSG